MAVRMIDEWYQKDLMVLSILPFFRFSGHPAEESLGSAHM